MKKLDALERMQAIRNGEAESQEVISELRKEIEAMFECANSMLKRVSPKMLRTAAFHNGYISLSIGPTDEYKDYSIGYDSGYEYDTLCDANEEEEKKLASCQEFLICRYGFEWAYSWIYYDMKSFVLISESGDSSKYNQEILAKHLKEAFPEMQIKVDGVIL